MTVQGLALPQQSGALSIMNTRGSFDGWARLALTLVLLAILVWWLWEARGRVATEPLIKDGVVVVDAFKNTQTILLLVVPLATTAIGYWFGAQGKEKAEEKAAQAEEKAGEASAQLTAVVGASTDDSLLEKARTQYPEAFGTASAARGGRK